jgi:transcriptional regulator with XRE-family HTH domain
MKEIVKIHYVLDKEDKKSIQKQMIDLNLNYRKLAQQLGISLAYVADLLNGNRNLTKELKDKLEILGIQLKGEE